MCTAVSDLNETIRKDICDLTCQFVLVAILKALHKAVSFIRQVYTDRIAQGLGFTALRKAFLGVDEMAHHGGNFAHTEHRLAVLCAWAPVFVAV